MKNFKSETTISLSRYLPIIIFIFGFYVIFPILWKGTGVLMPNLKIMFLSNIPKAIIFTLLPLFFQLIFIIKSSSNIKNLEIRNDSIAIKFFGIFYNKIIEFKYPNLISLEFTSDKNFIFTTKNGEKYKIYASIKNREEAYNLIQQKIKR